MFDLLDDTERIELSRRLARSAHRLLHEYELLKTAPPAVLRMYVGERGQSSDWLMAGIECAELVQKVLRTPVMAGPGWSL